MEVKINNMFVGCGIGGGVVASAVCALFMPLDFGVISGCFIGSIVTVGFQLALSGERLIMEKEPEPTEPKMHFSIETINHQATGYARARGWKAPFTPEQLSRLEALDGEVKYELTVLVE